MGIIYHDVVIVTVSGYAHESNEYGNPRQSVADFAATLDPEWRMLLIGPVPHVMNSGFTYAWLPDGSKEGWDHSILGDSYRARFLDLFRFKYDDGSSPFEIAAVRFGSDFGPATITNPVPKEQS